MTVFIRRCDDCDFNETILGQDTVGDDEFQVRRQQKFRMDFHICRSRVRGLGVGCGVHNNEKAHQV